MKQFKYLASILIVFTIMLSTFAAVSAQNEIKDVHWGEDKADATYLYFNTVNGYPTYKVTLFKDGKEVAKFVEEHDSSDGAAYFNMWGFIRHHGFGRYTAFVEGSTLSFDDEEFDSYIQTNTEENIPTQIKSTLSSNSFNYDSPFQYRGEGAFAYPIDDYWEYVLPEDAEEMGATTTAKPQSPTVPDTPVVDYIIATTVPSVANTLPAPKILMLGDINNELFTVIEETDTFITGTILPTIKQSKNKWAQTPVDTYNTRGDVNSYGEPVAVDHKYYDGYTAKDILDMNFESTELTEKYYHTYFGKTSANSPLVWGVSTYYNYGYIQLFSEVDEEYFACYNPFTNALYRYPGPMSSIDDKGVAYLECDNKVYKVQFRPTLISVLYNGKRIGFDQLPVIENGRTLVPLRAIFEKIGATVEWDGETQTVIAKSTENGTIIRLTIDSTTAIVNGVQVGLDVPAKIINGRTLVPVRFVSDCFGVGVDWNADIQSVILTSK